MRRHCPPEAFHDRRAPPWWPREERWPPPENVGRTWRRMQGRLFRRLALLFVLLTVFTTGAVVLVGWLAAALGSAAPGAPWPPYAGPAALLLAVALVVVARRLGGLARPAGEMMVAAGELADGHYDVRVREQGPPDLRRLARAFNRMADRLRAHEQQRRNLLADVTHELRTPLAVMQGNLEGILDGVYPRDDAHLLPVLEETRLLSALVEDLRTLALSEAGQLPLHRERVDLAALARDALASVRPRAEDAGVAVVADAEADPPVLDVDPVRIRQVLTILLDNAVRHTPPGGSITVSVRRDGAGTTAGAEISVADTGSGIAPEDLPRVFDRFYKSPGSRGSGLGLTIARQLVVLHGGQIAVESPPGRGTTVRFTLRTQ
jgi:signal transduction histidine kinase